MDLFKDWVVMGTADVDGLVDQNCITLEDFERNFKSIKVKGREVEKLPK